MPEGRPVSTKEDIAFFEQLENICPKPGKKSRSLIRDCAWLKTKQQLEYDQRQSELRLIAQIEQNTKKMEAITYVVTRMNSLQTEGMLLSNALQKASGEYDNILGARAADSPIGEVVFTLFLTLLPELKIVGRSVSAFLSSPERANSVLKAAHAVTWAKAKNWSDFAAGIASIVEKKKFQDSVMTSFGQYLDNQSKDIIEAIKNPTASNSSVDAETERRMKAFNAKNRVLTDTIKLIERRLVFAAWVERVFYQFIFWYDGPDILEILKNIFSLIGFDEKIAYDPRSYELFADLLLYDMLRAYASRNCLVWINEMYRTGFPKRAEDFPVYDFEGLDEAQRKKIYEKFNSKVWRSQKGYGSLSNTWNLTDQLGIRVVTTRMEYGFTGPMRIYPVDLNPYRNSIR